MLLISTSWYKINFFFFFNMGQKANYTGNARVLQLHVVIFVESL